MGLHSVGAGQVHGGDEAVGPQGVYPVSASGAAGGICVADQGGQGLGGQGGQQAPCIVPVPGLT